MICLPALAWYVGLTAPLMLGTCWGLSHLGRSPGVSAWMGATMTLTWLELAVLVVLKTRC